MVVEVVLDGQAGVGVAGELHPAHQEVREAVVVEAAEEGKTGEDIGSEFLFNST